MQLLYMKSAKYFVHARFVMVLLLGFSWKRKSIASLYLVLFIAGISHNYHHAVLGNLRDQMSVFSNLLIFKVKFHEPK